MKYKTVATESENVQGGRAVRIKMYLKEMTVGMLDLNSYLRVEIIIKPFQPSGSIGHEV